MWRRVLDAAPAAGAVPSRPTRSNWPTSLLLLDPLLLDWGATGGRNVLDGGDRSNQPWSAGSPHPSALFRHPRSWFKSSRDRRLTLKEENGTISFLFWVGWLHKSQKSRSHVLFGDGYRIACFDPLQCCRVSGYHRGICWSLCVSLYASSSLPPLMPRTGKISFSIWCGA